MAVALEELYEEIAPQYGMQLQTESCFQKVIEWIHMIEDKQFIKLLHGNELILNTGVPYVSTEWLKDYIEQLHEANAGGLVICVHDGAQLPEEILEYANGIQFPVFTAGWDCPFVELTRRFAEILLKNEQKETNLITALKNAIFYPNNEEGYVAPFERNGYYTGHAYTMMIVSCNEYKTENGNFKLKQLEKELQYSQKRKILFEEQGVLFVLSVNETVDMIRKEIYKLCNKDSHIFVGIGSSVEKVQDIHKSYAHAKSAYQLTKSALNSQILCYDELGVYKMLSNLKEPGLGDQYIEEVLGELIFFDKNNQTDFVHILQVFFENECSILMASKALYCHKNTLTYKLNKIKDILGYDILANEKRMAIMLAFHLLKMRQ